MAKFTLDDLEIERNDEPFEYEASDGSVFKFRDPKSMAATELLGFVGLTSRGVMAKTLDGRTVDELLALPEADGYFLDAICKKFIAHYGIGSPGEGKASPR